MCPMIAPIPPTKVLLERGFVFSYTVVTILACISWSLSIASLQVINLGSREHTIRNSNTHMKITVYTDEVSDIS